MMQKKLAAGLAVLLAVGTALGGCGESGAAEAFSCPNCRKCEKCGRVES